VQAVSGVSDDFAPGQYLDLTDDQKLSRPAFEPFLSGARLAGADAELHGTAVETRYEWDTVYPHEPTLAASRLAMSLADHAAAAVLAAGAVGKFQAATGNPYETHANPVQLADPGRAAIRRVRDLATDPSVSTQFTTTTEAARTLETLAASSPELAGSLQLVGIGAAA
jgi:hypothetical protein